MSAGCICGRTFPDKRSINRINEEETVLRPRPRSMHVGILLHSELVVFGGCNENGLLCMCVIWTCTFKDTNAAYWRKHLIPRGQAIPTPCSHGCAVELDGAVYMHGGRLDDFGGDVYDLRGHGRNLVRGRGRNLVSSGALWRLKKDGKGHFNWQEIIFSDPSAIPSPRSEHNGWQFHNRMWIFGGRSSAPSGYLHKHGIYKSYSSDRVVYVNNQLLCYNPRDETWIDMAAHKAPSPRFRACTATCGNKLWLHGGENETGDIMPDYHSLPLPSNQQTDINLYVGSLAWTNIRGGLAPDISSLSPLGSNRLVAYLANNRLCTILKRYRNSYCDILIPHSLTASLKGRRGHSAIAVDDDRIIIFGGSVRERYRECNNDVMCLKVNPYRARSLQNFAKRAVYKHRKTLQLFVHRISPLFRHCLIEEPEAETAEAMEITYS